METLEMEKEDIFVQIDKTKVILNTKVTGKMTKGRDWVGAITIMETCTMENGFKVKGKA